MQALETRKHSPKRVLQQQLVTWTSKLLTLQTENLTPSPNISISAVFSYNLVVSPSPTWQSSRCTGKPEPGNHPTVTVVSGNKPPKSSKIS